MFLVLFNYSIIIDETMKGGVVMAGPCIPSYRFRFVSAK
jgi:hypothetical protein